MVQAVTKSLITTEDIARGVGTVNQTRAGTDYTLHRVNIPITFETVADMVADTTLIEGDEVVLKDYATGNNAGLIFGTIVASGTGPDDGGSYINLPNTTPPTQFQQNFDTSKITPQLWGANRTTDSSSALNSALAYINVNKSTLFFTDQYAIASTVIFPAGDGYSVIAPEHLDLGVNTRTGFKWIGGNNEIMVEINEIRLCNISAIVVSNADTQATGCIGVLWHNSDNSLAASNHNRIGTIYVDRAEIGLQLGDFTNDTYNSNIDDNIIHNYFCYNTTNPLLIDSIDQDNNIIYRFHAGGVPSLNVETRDYIIRALNNGIGFKIIDGFAVCTNMKTDQVAIDIQSGSFSCEKFSLEGSNCDCRAIDITSTTTRDQSVIKQFTSANNIADTSGLIADLRGRSGMKLDNCSFANGSVQYSRPLIAIGTVFIDGEGFNEDGSNASLIEIGTTNRADANSIINQSNIIRSDGYSIITRSQQTTATIFTNLNLGGVFPALLTANTAISAPSNVIDSRDIGREIEYIITGDSASIFTVTFNAVFKLAGNAYVHSGIDKVDVIAFRWDGVSWRETRRSMNQNL